MVPKCQNSREIPVDFYSTIYLIDGDNYHLNDSVVFADPKKLYLYFVAKNNLQPIPFMFQQRYENFYVLISEAIGRDAVDHFITLTLGQLSIRCPEK